MSMRTATKQISILGLLTTVLMLAACAAGQETIEGKWKISGYNFGDKRAFPLDKMEVTLTVDPDMHIGGRSACNIYSGGIKLGSGGAMKLAAITSTDMACDEINGSFEGEFLEVLSKAARYEVKGDMLTITDTLGHFLRFQRDGKPRPAEKPQPTDNPQPVDDPQRAQHEILFVANKMSPCSSNQTLKCLRVKNEKNDAWQDHYDVIVGFKPKPGRFYKIEIERVGDPRSARPGVFRHKLVRILKTSTREKDIYR